MPVNGCAIIQQILHVEVNSVTRIEDEGWTPKFHPIDARGDGLIATSILCEGIPQTQIEGLARKGIGYKQGIIGTERNSVDREQENQDYYGAEEEH